MKDIMDLLKKDGSKTKEFDILKKRDYASGTLQTGRVHTHWVRRETLIMQVLGNIG